MGILTDDYIKQECGKDVYWNKDEGYFEIVEFTKTMEQIVINRYGSKINSMNKEIESLRTKLAEAERDAARYRWLRENNNGGIVEVSVSDTELGAAWLYKEHDLDAAIDAAMEQEK